MSCSATGKRNLRVSDNRVVRGELQVPEINSSITLSNEPAPGGKQTAGLLQRLTPWIFGILVLSAYLYHTKHYAFLGDDCFISFRYAQNLNLGHGLVYNPGEFVEGYTNFLWVLMMAAAMQLGLPVEVTSQAIGVTSGLVLLYLLTWLGARSSRWSDPLIWVAPLALALNRSFCAWCTGGLATQFFSLLVFSGFLFFWLESCQARQRPWCSALLFSLASLTRPEGILFCGVAGLFFATDVVLLKRRSWFSLGFWLSLYVPLVAVHFLWRHAYYGYWLPNTFYAKVSGIWLSQGMAYLRLFVDDHQLWWLLPLLVLVLFDRDRRARLFSTILLFYTAYLLYVGGDRFEYRFLVTVLPYLFWLLQHGIRQVVTGWNERGWPRWAGATIGAALSLLVMFAAYHPHTLNYKNKPPRHGIASLEHVTHYAKTRSFEGRFLRTLVKEGYLQGNELIAVIGAGALPYYSRLPTLDTLGLNDTTIAHQEITERGVVAHEKRASYTYLQQRHVVIFDVLNRLVLPPDADPYDTVYQGKIPLRIVQALDHYLVFRTTLSDKEFRRIFSRFKILQ